MIHLEKIENCDSPSFIVLKILGSKEYHQQLCQIDNIKTIAFNQHYEIPYTKVAYKQFLSLNIEFRIPTSNSSNHNTNTDSPSIGHEPPATESLTISESSRVDIAKGEKWKTEVKVDFISSSFAIHIPYQPEAIAWTKGLYRSYWSSKNKCWIAKGTMYNLESIQRCTSIFSDERYGTLKNIILSSANANRLDIWQSPEQKDIVFLKASGHGIDIEFIKKISGRAYEKNFKRWTIPYDAGIIDRLVTHYVKGGTKVNYRLPAAGKVYQKVNQGYAETLKRLLDKVPKQHKSYLKQYVDTMARQRYSHQSIKQYTGKFLRFITFFAQRVPDSLSPADVNDYLAKLSKENISDSALNISVSAIRFYYTKVIYLPNFEIDRIRRPRSGKYLPTILSQNEVSKLLAACQNLKHSSILYTLYSSGIRLNELLNIKLTDIYWDRNQIFVRGGKGKKDRVVQLSYTLKSILILYFNQYKPIFWLYEGHIDNVQYSSSSVQKIVRASAKKAGIQRKVTPHVLRHCYATHLHDGGTSIKYIQELLGHKDIKTTLVYTHVSTQEVSKIISPLDQLMRENEKNRNQ